MRIKATCLLKRQCHKWVAKKIYSEKQLSYNLKKGKERQCATRVLHNERKSGYLLNKISPK